MKTELEAKFLHVNHRDLRHRLQVAGAVLVHGERLMRRRNYNSLENPQLPNGWARVRDEGDRVTLSFKQLTDRSIHGTKEACVEVSNFEHACEVLAALGLKPSSYQETKRESWMLGEVEVELDTWPWVDPLIELEGPTEAQLKAAARALQLDWSQALHGSVEIAYQDEYDVSEPEINSWKEILFIPVPEWLAVKRKD